MTDATTFPHIDSPSADDYAAADRRRLLTSYAWCAAGSALLAFLYALAFHKASMIPPLAALALVTVPVLLWRYPGFAAYAVIASACLFETNPLNWPDSLTDNVPFFWNVNTVLQRYAGVDVHAFPLNVLEVFLLLALSVSLFRSVYARTVRIRVGGLFWPIAAYIAFVCWGWLHGVSSGGDFKISLQEVRAQFYFLAAYLMAVNLNNAPWRVRDPDTMSGIDELPRLLWVIVLSIGFKAILYTIRRIHYITLGGMALPDQGVGSHEEAFFFDCFIILFLVCLICNVYPKPRRAMWLLLPVVLIADLACNRRAAIAAMIVVIPILMLAAYRGLPHSRRLIASIALALVVGFSVYYPIYKDRYGMLAQPARAIQSQFDPDTRDKSSDDYRVAEEKDLYATIKSSPLIGYGFGRSMLHAVPIADISKTYAWWDIMTHNQILWVWMRVGTVGFIAFWLMIVSIIVAAARVVQDEQSSPESVALGLFVMLVISALLVFGLLDLQLSNFRDMLFAGFLTGYLAGWGSARGAIPPSSITDAARVGPSGDHLARGEGS